MNLDFDTDRWARVRDAYRRWWDGELGRPLINLTLRGRDPGRPEPRLPSHEFISFYDLDAMQTNRRSFLKRAGAATGAAAVFPTLIPSSVLGADAPSKKITLGCIGLRVHGFGVNLNNFLAQAQTSLPPGN